MFLSNILMIFFLETKTTKRIHNTNDTPKIRSYLVRESGKKKCVEYI